MSLGPRLPTSRAPVVLVVLALVAIGACTGGKPEPQDIVRFAPTACPSDVSDALPALQVTCGYLTVPERHADADGGTIDVFVARIRGADPVSPDPLVVIGGKDIGAPVHYADDIAPMPARVGREIVVLEPRGTGHDRPTLTCPEVDTFDADHVGRTLVEPDVAWAFSGAVTTCADRLRDQGIELAAYTLEESAADVVDLAAALGLDSFNIGTYGYNSKIAFGVLRRAPVGLRSVYMDSPVFPDQTLSDVAGDGTRSALEALDAACAHQSACRRVLPDVEEEAETAVASLHEHPLRVEVAGMSVEVDGTAGARVIRDFLSFAPAVVPRVIVELAEGDVTDIASYLSSVRPSCFGYRLFCRISDASPAWGEILSIVCHDRATLGSSSSPEVPTGPALARAFASHPYLEACGTWRAAAMSAEGTRVFADVPTLLLHGELDPFSTTPDDATLATMSHVYAYDFTGQSTNPLGQGDATCAREIRAAFVADPTSPPDSGCVGSLKVARLSP